MKKWRMNYCDNWPNKQCYLGAAYSLNGPVQKRSIRTGSTRWNQTHFMHFPAFQGEWEPLTWSYTALISCLVYWGMAWMSHRDIPYWWTNHIGHCSHFNGWEPVIVRCRLFTFSACNFFLYLRTCHILSTFVLFFFLIPSALIPLAQMLLHIRIYFCDI